MKNIKEYVKQEKERMRAACYGAPSLLIVDATNDDPANEIYIRNKVKDFEGMGWPVRVLKVNSSLELLAACQCVSKDYDGVIVQLPVREEIEFDPKWIPAEKDCDGLNSEVVPATVRGILDSSTWRSGAADKTWVDEELFRFEGS